MNKDTESGPAEEVEKEDQQYHQMDLAAKAMGYNSGQDLLEMLEQREFRGVPPDHMVPTAQRFSGIALRQAYKTRRKPNKRKNK